MNDRSYTKLFSGIVTSTIWLEDSDTRVVWITLLALQDRYYEVHSSPGALARIAGVPPDKCNAALEKFMSPDPDSNNKAEGGRRVARVQGGWKIINGEFYRHLMSADERKEYKREKEHERREKIKNRGQCVDNRGQTVDTRGQILADKDKDVEEDKDIKKEPSISPLKGDEIGPDQIYDAYPKKTGKLKAIPAIAKAIAAISKRDTDNSAEWLVGRVKRYAAARVRANEPQFTKSPAAWMNGGHYDDDESTWEPHKTAKSTDGEDVSWDFYRNGDGSGYPKLTPDMEAELGEGLQDPRPWRNKNVPRRG